ncbi:hypothetical protein [uncultured Thermanaerothrix sp.]|uniref:hypothetical protein n=1 Tax=uncultured Thermanaerothrix sp. TaxID=1195149 RepID=UPI00260CB8F6|nr:hypothetical protein [uncultured Thermanaerothrix sp.]
MKNTSSKSYLWWVAWVIFIVLATDFYEWGAQPHLWLGHPLWLWRLVALVLVIGFVYAWLARTTWEDDEA